MNTVIQFVLSLVEKAFGLFSAYLLGKKNEENKNLKTHIENDRKVIEAHNRLSDPAYRSELRKRYKR